MRVSCDSGSKGRALHITECELHSKRTKNSKCGRYAQEIEGVDFAADSGQTGWRSWLLRWEAMAISARLDC